MDPSCHHTPQALPRHSILARLRRPELATLLILLLIVAGIWGFAELADEVMEDQTTSFDKRILLAMRNPADPADPRGPEWIEEIGRDLTALGGMAALTFLTLAVSGYLLLDGKRRAAAFVLVAITGGMLLSLVLKESFHRPRPDLVPYGSKILTTSFPSGHSMMSAVTYLTLGALLARLNRRPALKAYVMILAVLLTMGVGVSRVYVGVHWPTDVLAGWTAGATWALICWLAASWLQSRGHVEADSSTQEPSR